MNGEVIGNYRVTRILGKGGMGEVYLAQHTLLGRFAAIKMLQPELGAKPELVERFFNEARAAASIENRGIVEIYDFGYHNGNAFIVMEYLSGESLSERIRRVGRLPIDQAVSVTRQLAGALGSAHRAGIAHRDLKPDNIFIVPDNEVPGGERIKIVDFGIAKLASEQQQPGSYRTRTGVVIGTPTYMAPEQCKGSDAVDHRVDLYALGCILYEMLCGRPPFIARGAGELIAQHIYVDPPEPRTLNPEISEPLEAVILHLLAKDAEARFQTAPDVIRSLDACAAPGGAGTAQRAAAHMSLSAPTEAASAQDGPPTTLSALAGSQPRTHSASRGRYVTLGVATAIVLIIATVIAQNLDDEQPVASSSVADRVTSEPAPQIAVDAAPEPVAQEPVEPVAQEPVEPPQPTDVAVAIESTPEGAVVYQMPEREPLGTTPLDATLPTAGGERRFTVELRGYENAEVVMPADRDGHVSVELVRKRTPKPRRPARKPKRKSKRKPDADGALDPYR